MRKLLTALTIISTSVFAGSGIQKDLENAFNALDYKYNVTSAYASQSAGYYSGGSLYARNQIRNQQIAYINLPKISSGCGGIDMYVGGFSFITKDEAVGLAKKIMSSAGTYAFHLALESVSPLISNTMKDLSRKVSEFTNQSINSCETATGLVGSIFPKTEESQRSVCQSVANGESGIFGGLADARMGCSDYDKRSKVFKDLKTKPGYDHQLLGSMNFAWKAIRNNALFKDDDDLSELMMSLSGTIIYQDKDPHTTGASKQQLPSLAISNEFINALMNGGKLRVYGCDDKDECLTIITDKYVEIPKEKSFINLVKTKLTTIVNKIQTNDELKDSEIKFIQSTTLPVYKMLNVQSAFTRGLSTLDVTTYSEVIATDMLYLYLEESMQEIITKAKALELPDAEYREFINGIEQAKQNIRNRKLDTYKQRALTMQMIEQTMLIEKRLALQLQSSFKDALTWADSL
ncbi:MAG: conjugal transfer protein TraH [Rickettsiaceae bacterium]|nr:conjugal transfer protein TraH [Rickettsiaceae bacterium]